VLTDAIREFYGSPAGQAAVAVLVVGIADLVLGILAAFRDNVFSIEAVAAWLRSTLSGRILPIWVLLFVGYFAQGIQVAGIPLLLAAGIGAGGLFVTETVGTIVKQWGPTKQAQTKPDA